MFSKFCIHGECVWTSNTPKCACDDGFEGKFCENLVRNTSLCDGYNCNGGNKSIYSWALHLK